MLKPARLLEHAARRAARPDQLNLFGGDLYDINDLKRGCVGRVLSGAGGGADLRGGPPNRRRRQTARAP
eukprot:221837-Lingulodinium_polyedra.AAC.1